MNIGKLNFEKLHKLISRDNRLRIARAVERSVKRRWEQAGIQGYGNEKYAETHAKLILDGLSVDRILGRVSREGFDFVVYAYTTEAGREILKRRQGLTLREWVRLCWKYGCQPRVFNPFLPNDFEQRNSLDHFGNNLRITTVNYS